MSRKEKLLFEKYFYIITNSKIAKKDNLMFAINCILSSKEFNNSLLKISDSDLKSELLSLSVNTYKGGYCFKFSGLYYVTDGHIIENRSIYGTIFYNSGHLIMQSVIDRYGDVKGLKHCELYEIIECDYENDRYSRYSNYFDLNFKYEDFFSVDEFEKSKEFVRKFLKKIKK